MAQQEKRGRGCLFYLAIILALAGVVVIAAAWAGTHYSKRIVNEFTASQSMPMADIELSSDERVRLNDQISEFGTALRDGKAVEPLTLTVPQANAWIATDTRVVSLRHHFEFRSFSADQISGTMSYPGEQLGLMPLRGRFINATGTFSLEVRSNRIQFNAVSLSTPGGKAFPPTFAQAIRMRNLAAELNAMPQITNALKGVQSIEVRDGKLIILPKK